MRFETVLFDLDGTLIDSGDFHFGVVPPRDDDRARPDDPRRGLMANVGGHGIHAQMLEFDAERADELVRVYRDHNLAAYHAVTAFHGVPSVLERLHAEDPKLGVVTVKSRPTVMLTFEVLPLGRYFRTVVTGDDTVRHKPEPEPLLLALERLGATPGSAAYVGDSPFDIQAAKAAGMTAIGVSSGWDPLSSAA